MNAPRNHPANPTYPAWTSSIEPAPGDLRIVQAFVNTRDFEQDTDELATPEQLAAWLRHWNLLDRDAPSDAVDEAQRRTALELREGLRTLLLANNGEPVDGEALTAMRRIARNTRPTIEFDADGAGRLEGDGASFEGALARLLGIVVTAQLEGTWSRLKACARDICHWGFYDASKNRSGKWCSMRSCGNLVKAKAYRRRRKASA